MQEIKTCPFCGSTAGVAPEDLQISNGLWGVYCDDCTAAGPVADNGEDAIEYWNERII